MELEFTFDEMGAWSRAPADLKAALADDIEADVVVIGGGCTGLSTALQLRAAGADVIVLEEDFAGSGASGLNTGVVTGAIVQDLSLTRRLLGPELAAARAGFADAAVKYLEEVIELHGVQCDYTPSGTLTVTIHPSQEPELNKKREMAQEYGSPVRFLSSGEMRERGLPPAFLSGVLEEQGGTLDPGKYMSGLRTAAIGAGVRLFEADARDRADGWPQDQRGTEGGKSVGRLRGPRHECLHAGAGASWTDRGADSRLALRDRSLRTGAARTARMAWAGAGQHGTRARRDLPALRSRHARGRRQGRPLPLAEQARRGE